VEEPRLNLKDWAELIEKILPAPLRIPAILCALGLTAVVGWLKIVRGMEWQGLILEPFFWLTLAVLSLFAWVVVLRLVVVDPTLRKVSIPLFVVLAASSALAGYKTKDRWGFAYEEPGVFLSAPAHFAAQAGDIWDWHLEAAKALDPFEVTLASRPGCSGTTIVAFDPVVDNPGAHRPRCTNTSPGSAPNTAWRIEGFRPPDRLRLDLEISGSAAASGEPCWDPVIRSSAAPSKTPPKEDK
jgi:hypothetical protein